MSKRARQRGDKRERWSFNQHDHLTTESPELRDYFLPRIDPALVRPPPLDRKPAEQPTKPA